MATSVQAARGAGAAQPPDESAALQWVIRWVKGHPQTAGALAAVAVLGGALGWWTMVSKARTEAAAGGRLGEARMAFESRNYPLAASELSQIVENYAGTRAADEAELLRAQVRLYQGQSQQAIDLLKAFAPSAGRDFRAQAYGLLAAAYENAGHTKEGAEAYEQAAEHARYPFLRAQYLSDAGRAWVALGDTGRALSAYGTIASKLDSTATAVEAKVRIGELTGGAGTK